MWINRFFSKALPEKEEAVWLILFTPAQNFEWWRFLTWHRKNFDHVSAISYNAQIGSWFLVDWSAYGLWCQPVMSTEVDIVLATAMEQGWPVLKMKSRTCHAMPIFGTFCVNAVKHLLGVRSFAITPYQLYCALRKMGAEVIV